MGSQKQSERSACDTWYSGHNFNTFRHSFIIFGTNHPETSVY